MLAQPADGSPLLAAVNWVAGSLLGPVATSVAVIAVAWIGYRMLFGEVDLRRGLTVVLGCFILFGASTIVAGIRAAIVEEQRPPRLAHAPPPPVVPPLNQLGVSADPYAGASVPAR
jgi:type IV secretory pathway VirB2 component (pilin)